MEVGGVEVESPSNLREILPHRVTSYQTGETETFPLIVKLGLTLSNNISPAQTWSAWHLIRVLKFLRVFSKNFFGLFEIAATLTPDV